MGLRTHKDKRFREHAAGFSLLELLLVVAILVIVMGVITSGLNQMQQRTTAESSKVDTVQQTRDFIDQMVRDVHNVGYPPPIVMNPPAPCAGNAGVSCGIIFFSPTKIQYEGDLDGRGTVYQVTMELVPPPGSNNCPCILRRGALDKASALAGTPLIYFTEVNGVLNSGDGAGGATYPVSLPGPGSYGTYATADVFDAYFDDGNKFQSPTATYACDEASAPLSCAGIRSLQISANVTSHFADPKTKMYQVYSITSKARLNN
jgi:prepilin-type N-terminal cleavage/methylation domain-containing protein